LDEWIETRQACKPAAGISKPFSVGQAAALTSARERQEKGVTRVLPARLASAGVSFAR